RASLRLRQLRLRIRLRPSGGAVVRRRHHHRDPIRCPGEEGVLPMTASAPTTTRTQQTPQRQKGGSTIGGQIGRAPSELQSRFDLAQCPALRSSDLEQAFAYGNSDFGYASAQAVVLLFVVVIITAIQFGVLERKVFYR